MRILIATGIYPPDIGGPAQYAKNLALEFRKMGHQVKVLSFSKVKKFPTGVRHLLYFFWILFSLKGVDFVLALDTFSVAFPVALAKKIFPKKTLMRIGGDFLWESFIERTGKKVLLRNFYETELKNLSLKERIIFSITKWNLKVFDVLIFTTKWQFEIWKEPYKIDYKKVKFVENYFGPKKVFSGFSSKNFLSASRESKIKNLDALEMAFEKAREENQEIILTFKKNLSYEKLLEKIKNSYALILVSLSEVSPNFILDGIRFGKPFILTKETGFYDKLKDVGIFVDPLNVQEIKEKILFLAKEENYKIYQKKIAEFNFVHTFEDIAKEIIEIVEKI